MLSVIDKQSGSKKSPARKSKGQFDTTRDHGEKAAASKYAGSVLDNIWTICYH